MSSETLRADERASSTTGGSWRPFRCMELATGIGLGPEGAGAVSKCGDGQRGESHAKANLII